MEVGVERKDIDGSRWSQNIAVFDSFISCDGIRHDFEEKFFSEELGRYLKQSS